MIELSAHVYGDGQDVRGALLSLRHAVQDIRPALPRVVTRFRIQMATRFRTEGASGPSGRWKALSPRYATWKAKNYPGRKILELTGALKGSLVGDGPGSIVSYGDNSVFIGSSVPYAEYHQTGTSKMPARPPIEPSDRDVSEWVVEVKRHFDSALERGSKVRGRLVTAFK